MQSRLGGGHRTRKLVRNLKLLFIIRWVHHPLFANLASLARDRDPRPLLLWRLRRLVKHCFNGQRNDFALGPLRFGLEGECREEAGCGWTDKLLADKSLERQARSDA